MGGCLIYFCAKHCKTFTPKRLHARNGSMKSISIHVSTTFGAFPHVREMSVADAGDEILGQRAIFQETLRHLLWSICEGSRGTDTCLQILCLCRWVSLLRQYELCLFKMFGWISLPCHCRSINLPDLTCQVDVRVGYYTSVYGLGRHPRDTQVLVFGKKQLAWRRWTFQRSIKKISRLKINRHGPKSKGALCNVFAYLYSATSFGKAPCSARVNHV